jgi:hypothetical protein
MYSKKWMKSTRTRLGHAQIRTAEEANDEDQVPVASAACSISFTNRAA